MQIKASVLIGKILSMGCPFSQKKNSYSSFMRARCVTSSLTTRATDQNIIIDNNALKPIDHYKFLEVTADNKASLKRHFKAIWAKAAGKNNIISCFTKHSVCFLFSFY